MQLDAVLDADIQLVYASSSPSPIYADKQLCSPGHKPLRIRGTIQARREDSRQARIPPDSDSCFTHEPYVAPLIHFFQMRCFSVAVSLYIKEAHV